ncbi:MAG: glycosyltransferase [Crocosphaera sp.]|nr:glycosyltransferase [Crocosphaera sp.]
MKIAFIVGEFPILSETFILNQITGLIDRGHEVDIYAEIQGNTHHVHPSVNTYKLLKKTYYLPQLPESTLERIIKGFYLIAKFGIQDPIRILQSLNIFKYGKQSLFLWLLYSLIPNFNKDYDIIHCQFGHLSFRGMAFQAINSPHAQLITIFRGFDISTFVEMKGKHIYDKLFNQGDFFLANCEFFRKKAIALGCPVNLIQVHFSGLDCKQFTFKPRYLKKDEKIRIATTGRLVEKKGIEYSIRAVAKQAKINPNLEYNIIGDGELRPDFEQLIKDLGMEDIIKIVGWKNETEIKKILDESHIFIAPSVTAKDGNQDAPINVLKEAMAMGLPVISTYHGGIPELVEDGVSGFLVPERNVDSLADKLNDLITHPEIWEKMGQAGRNYVEKYYDLEMLNNKLIEVYQQLIKTKKKSFDPKLQSITLIS